MFQLLFHLYLQLREDEHLGLVYLCACTCTSPVIYTFNYFIFYLNIYFIFVCFLLNSSIAHFSPITKATNKFFLTSYDNS